MALNLNINSTLFWTGVSDQEGKALSAASTAELTSSTVQHGASAISSPVLEFVTGIYFPVADSFHSLLRQYLSLLTIVIGQSFPFRWHLFP